MPASRLIAFTAAVVALAGALASSLAHGAPRRENGPIAFARYRFVDSPLRQEIWVANPDGSGLRQVSHAPANFRDSNPSWAPDGKRLVFTRCPTADDGTCQIWAVNADGSGQRMLSAPCSDPTSSSCVSEDNAVYSPDGRTLVYNRGTPDVGRSEIAMSDPNLEHARIIRLAPTATPDIGAFAWSPGGGAVAFEARSETKSAIFVMKANGRRFRQLTPWRLRAYNGDQIDWSADGRLILFRSTTSEEPGRGLPPHGDIYTIHPNGTGLRRLTHLPLGSGLELGSFSPDGKWIVFASSAGATTFPDGGGPWPDIFRMKVDGTGLRPVTRTKNWEGSPEWGNAR